MQMLPDWNPQMEELAREVFSQVRTSIVMKMRFLDMAVFRLKPFAAPVTLATDGDHLFYHPVWLLKWYREESSAVTRDYMHVLLQPSRHFSMSPSPFLPTRRKAGRRFWFQEPC